MRRYLYFLQKNMALWASTIFLHLSGQFVTREQSRLFGRFRTAMVVIILLRQRNYEPSVNRINLTRLFEFADGRYRKVNISIPDLCELLECDWSPKWREILAAARSIAKIHNKRIIRGKLALSTCCDLLTKFGTLGLTRSNGRPLKSKLDINARSAFAIIAEFTKPPRSLLRFFAANLVS